MILGHTTDIACTYAHKHTTHEKGKKKEDALSGGAAPFSSFLGTLRSGNQQNREPPLPRARAADRWKRASRRRNRNRGSSSEYIMIGWWHVGCAVPTRNPDKMDVSTKTGWASRPKQDGIGLAAGRLFFFFFLIVFFFYHTGKPGGESVLSSIFVVWLWFFFSWSNKLGRGFLLFRLFVFCFRGHDLRHVAMNRPSRRRLVYFLSSYTHASIYFFWLDQSTRCSLPFSVSCQGAESGMKLG